MASSPLADWENFYVMTGSAIAGFTGLTFVVIALAADAHRVNTVGLRAFVTPTIVHFGVSIGRVASNYVPVREDWRWNVALPTAAYGALLAIAFLIWQRPEQSMYAVAAVSVLLMFIGIHNAWDFAAWNSVRKQQDESA
jgi:hypothetical protein